MNTDFRTAAAPKACSLEEEYANGLKGIIFDCDGVLFDSKEANTAFYNHIRNAVGLPKLSEAEAAYSHMVSTDEALVRIIPPRLLEAAKEARNQTRYSDKFMPLMLPLPRMTAFLDYALEKGMRLALCTNRSDSVHKVLEHFELSRFFFPVMTVSQVPPKPDPEGLLRILETWGVQTCDVAYVGDSFVDEQAARRAGVPFWSFGNEELSARLHLSEFAEFFSLVEPLVDKA